MSHYDDLKKLVNVAIDAGRIGAMHSATPLGKCSILDRPVKSSDLMLTKEGLVTVCCTMMGINIAVGLDASRAELAYAAYAAAWEAVTHG